MGLQDVTRDVCGVQYTIRQLPGIKGRKLLLRLAKVLGPVASVIDGSVKSEDLGYIIKEVLDNISESDLEHLCKTLGAYSHVETEKGLQQLSLQFQDQYFAGKYREMGEWIKVALEVNYRDFFDSITKPDESNLEK